MTKHKHTKPKFAAKDRQDNKKFLLVLLIATIVLMFLVYLVFVR